MEGDRALFNEMQLLRKKFLKNLKNYFGKSNEKPVPLDELKEVLIKWLFSEDMARDFNPIEHLYDWDGTKDQNLPYEPRIPTF